MTALVLPYNLANQTDADAVEPEQNFNTIETYINAQVIRTDGVNAMAAQLQLVGDPVSDNDAARKAYVDAILPVGVILPYGGSAAPAGQWALANGAALSTSTYPVLFAAFGYNYGGAGGSFNLPDLRGVVPVGVSTASPFNALGNTGGQKNAPIVNHTHTTPNHAHSLNSHVHQVDVPNYTGTSGNQNTSHNHSFAHTHPTVSNTSADIAGLGVGSVFTRQNTGGATQANYPLEDQVTGPASPTTTGNQSAAHQHSIAHNHPSFNSGAASGNTGNASPTTDNPSGGVSATNANLPPYVVINYIVRLG